MIALVLLFAALPRLDAGLVDAFRQVKAGRYEEGRRAAEAYLATPGAAHPGQAEFVVGLSFHQQKLYESARLRFARALEQEPDYATARYFLGFALLNLGRLDEAQRELTAYVAADPSHAEAHFGLGLVALEQDRARTRGPPSSGRSPSRRGARRRGRRRRRPCAATSRATRRAWRTRTCATTAWSRRATRWCARSRCGRTSSSPGTSWPACAGAWRRRGRRRGAGPLGRAVQAPHRRRDPMTLLVLLAAGALHFTDATARSGIALTLTSGGQVPTQVLEVKGGGVALFDCDNDGDLDLFVPNGATLDAPAAGPGARLFENLGGLRFRDATAERGIAFRGWGMGVAVGDVDGNGFDDLYIAAYGPDALLLNDGKRFTDATAAAGLGDARWGTAAAFGDLDGDGDLDLYVANYLEFDPLHPPPGATFRGQPVFAGPKGLAPAADALYENLGGGRFRDASASSGIAAVRPSYGLGVAILDFDADGRQDVFVGNDSMPSFLS
jgi:hypothetical protein